MIISERIFKLLKEKNIKQKEFAKKTGISESTISDWKRKQTNPASDKIMKICEVLDVSPYELLSPDDNSRFASNDKYVVEKGSDEYVVVRSMRELDIARRNRIVGYAEALAHIN